MMELQARFGNISTRLINLINAVAGTTSLPSERQLRIIALLDLAVAAVDYALVLSRDTINIQAAKRKSSNLEHFIDKVKSLGL